MAKSFRSGEFVAEIIAGNPTQRLKAIHYDQYGGVTQIEWHDEESAPAEAGTSSAVPSAGFTGRVSGADLNADAVSVEDPSATEGKAT